jgi:hypothetical protein
MKKNNATADLEQAALHRKIDPEEGAVLCISSLQGMQLIIIMDFFCLLSVKPFVFCFYKCSVWSEVDFSYDLCVAVSNEI